LGGAGPSSEAIGEGATAAPSTLDGEPPAAAFEGHFAGRSTRTACDAARSLAAAGDASAATPVEDDEAIAASSSAGSARVARGTATPVALSASPRAAEGGGARAVTLHPTNAASTTPPATVPATRERRDVWRTPFGMDCGDCVSTAGVRNDGGREVLSAPSPRGRAPGASNGRGFTCVNRAKTPCTSRKS
jgi:hypothetical protein